MPVTITPVTTTVHATHTAPAVLDPASGTEIAAVAQTLADNAAIALLRCGAYRLVDIKTYVATPATAGNIESNNTSTGTLWNDTVTGAQLTLRELLIDDIIIAHTTLYAKMSAGGYGAIRYGGDIPSAMSTENWIHVPENTDDRCYTLNGYGVVTADGDVLVQMFSGVTGGTLTIEKPIRMIAYALRANS